MAKKYNLSDDERKLFRDSIQGTRPLKQDKLPGAKVKKNKALPAQPKEEFPNEWHDEADHSPIQAKDSLLYRKPGLQDGVVKKLKKGLFPIQAKLDLHGHSSIQAKHKLYRFIHSAYEAHLKCVLVVHGKGYSSQNAHPVLKNNVNNWLRQSPYVTGFCTAQKKHGGTGAIYILIKSG